MTVVLQVILWLVPLLVSGALALAQDNTGWLNPSQHSGAFTNPTRAYTDNPGGDSFATAAHDAEHVYWGYTISIPAGREIVGIEVLLDARRHGGTNSRLFVELSWNNGTTWTTTGRSAVFDGTWRQLIVGSPTDTWGRTWTVGELTTIAFRVVLVAHRASRVDWVAVRVHHRVPVIPLTLSVTPQLVDIGTLTFADYDAGHREVYPAQRLTVSSPGTWSLHVAANAATWAYTGPEPPPGKPASHLEWRVSAVSPGVTDPQTVFIGLTTSQRRVAGGTAGTGLWLDIALRLLVDYTYSVPGTYQLGYTFTLTSP